MEQHGYEKSNIDLDVVFGALADPTRREILMRLMEGEASVNELAEPFSISQPAISRHLKVLERAGLVERDVDKQRRPVRLKAQELAYAVSWLNEFKAFWTMSFDRLDEVLLTMQQCESKDKNDE